VGTPVPATQREERQGDRIVCGHSGCVSWGGQFQRSTCAWFPLFLFQFFRYSHGELALQAVQLNKVRRWSWKFKNFSKDLYWKKSKYFLFDIFEKKRIGEKKDIEVHKLHKYLDL
jgi:hypothetical protein